MCHFDLSGSAKQTGSRAIAATVLHHAIAGMFVVLLCKSQLPALLSMPMRSLLSRLLMDSLRAGNTVTWLPHYDYCARTPATP